MGNSSSIKERLSAGEISGLSEDTGFSVGQLASLYTRSAPTGPPKCVRGYRCLSAGLTSSTSTTTGSWRGRTCSPCPSSASTPSATESSTHSSQKTRLSGTHRSCSSRQDRYTLMLPIIDQVDNMDLISRTLSTCWPTSDQFPINRGGWNWTPRGTSSYSPSECTIWMVMARSPRWTMV